jgi:hypothetical protein
MNRVTPVSVRGIPEVGDLVTHAGLHREGPAVFQLGDHLALHDVDDVAAVAPVIGEVAGRVFDEAHADVADVQRAPVSHPGFARMLRAGDAVPVGHGKRQRRNFHELIFSEVQEPEVPAG